MSVPNNDSPGSRASVVSVVVTYQPDQTVVENVRRLASQCRQVLIVDNASSGMPAGWVTEAASLPGVLLLRNETNLGIGSALNTGIRKALEIGCDWIATFDQDTAVSPEYFRKLLQTFSHCSASSQVGMIVPGGWVEPGRQTSNNTDELRWSYVIGAVNSGSLIRADVPAKIGFYDDQLFIDYVDTDYCLRLQRHGFKILSADAVLLEHELGEKQTRNILGCRISFRVHSAWRYYYNFRNRILLFRRFFTTFPKWVLWDGSRMFLEIGRIVFLEHGRGPKAKATITGIKDGILGRPGRHPLYPPPRR